MEVKEISVSCVHNKIINMSWFEQEGIFYTRNQNTIRSEREDHKPMAYVNDALSENMFANFLFFFLKGKKERQ